MVSDFFAGLAERQRNIALLLGRILLSAIFVMSGFNKLTQFAGFADSLAGSGLPLPMLWAVGAVAAELLGGLAILVGLWTRPAALLMFVFTGFTAVIGHPFWAADAASYQMQFVNFMKNLAIMGGFLALFVAGPGAVSLDGWRRR